MYLVSAYFYDLERICNVLSIPKRDKTHACVCHDLELKDINRHNMLIRH